MSKKKKRNSTRPKGFSGKPKPEEKIKRIVVFSFGLFLVGILLWSYTKSDMSSLLWWEAGIFGGMFLFGVYLIFIAAFPRQKQVNQRHEELLDASVNSIFRHIIDRLF